MCSAVYFEFKKLFIRKEFWIMLIVSAFTGGIAYAERIPYTYFLDSSSTLSSYKASMLYSGSGIGEMMLIVFIPLFASIAFSDSYFSEFRQRTVEIQITRISRAEYYWGKFIAVSITAFFISILPFIFNQLFCMIAFPMKNASPWATGSVYEVNFAQDIQHVLFPKFYMNKPAIDFFIHVFLIGIFGMNMGVLSFALTLFYRKNTLIAVGTTTLLYLIYVIILSYKNVPQFIPYYYFGIYPNWVVSINIGYYIIQMFILFLVNLLLSMIKIKRNIIS